jgi:hypothetical protein
MAADDAVWEWDVAGIGEVSMGEAIVGGVQAYHFQSRLSRYGAVYVLVNVGLGAEPPWKQYKKAMDYLKKFKAFKATTNKTWSLLGEDAYTRFYTDGAFSGDDLDWAVGQSYALGATFVAGYQLQAISATKLYLGNLFRFVNVSGPSVGLDINISVKTGVWLRWYATEYSG